MKNIKNLFLIIFLFAEILNAQVTFDKLFFDFHVPESNGTGITGIQIAPDGNVWITTYDNGAPDGMVHDTIFTASGDTVVIQPIYVLDPVTAEHVSFSPIRFLELPDGTVDTLNTVSYGIDILNNGNLLVSRSKTLYEVDYKTGKALRKWHHPLDKYVTQAVQSPADGNIYVMALLGQKSPMYILDADFNTIGNAIDSMNYINRTLEISQDGKTLYTGSTWSGFGIPVYHSDAPGLTPFTPVDTLGNWFNVPGKTDDGRDTVFEKINLWASCLDFAPDGLLWVGALKEVDPGGRWYQGAGKGSQWYAFDVSTGKIVDSIGIPFGDSTKGGFISPRGATWTADGKKMYLADWDYNTITIWSYNPPVSVEKTSDEIPANFTLSQNYPNPFNPTTTISFTLPKSGFVTLKVYNMLGQEVATLVNGVKVAGNYKATLNGKDLSSGTYIYSLKSGDIQITRKMTLLK